MNNWKKQICLGLVLTSFSCFSQTIEETKAFIERTVLNSPPVYYTAEAAFDGSKLLFSRTGLHGVGQYVFAIDLAGLSTIGQQVMLSSDGKHNYYNILMSASPGHVCSSLPAMEDQWRGVQSVELMFSDKDTANRVKKAILHLAGLLGAKTKDEDVLFR